MSCLQCRLSRLKQIDSRTGPFFVVPSDFADPIHWPSAREAQPHSAAAAITDGITMRVLEANRIPSTIANRSTENTGSSKRRRVNSQIR